MMYELRRWWYTPDSSYTLRTEITTPLLIALLARRAPLANFASPIIAIGAQEAILAAVLADAAVVPRVEVRRRLGIRDVVQLGIMRKL